MMKPLLALLASLWAGTASAATTPNPSTGLFVDTFLNGPSNDAANVAYSIVYFLLYISGTAAIMYMVVGGTQYIMSGANEDLAKTGKKRMQNAIIGLIIILLSYTIISVVIRTFSPGPATP
jgi:hypothetical protein